MAICIAYIGFSENALRKLLEYPKFILKAVIWQKGRLLHRELRDALCKRKIDLYEVSRREEAFEAANQSKCDIYLMYQFSYILPADMVHRYQIFNIHPGDLKTNRGAHPIGWTILLQEQQTYISLHKVGEKIDSGLLLAEALVDVRPNDTTKTLRERMEENLPSLFEALNSYLVYGDVSLPIIEEGYYRRRIAEGDYTIRPEYDTLAVMDAKIRSQAEYEGAVLVIGDKKYYVHAVRWKDNLN